MLSIDRAKEILNNIEYTDIVSKEQLEAIKASEMTILYGTKNQSIRYIGEYNGEIAFGDNLNKLTIDIGDLGEIKPIWNKTFWSFETENKVAKFQILDDDVMYSEGIIIPRGLEPLAIFD